MTITKLLPVNAFGMIRVTKDKITVNITAVLENGKAINRLFGQEIAGGIDEVEPDEIATAVFGIKIDDTDKWMLVMNEILPLKNLVSLGDLKDVGAAVHQAVELIKIATKAHTT
jgi:hypothetical protein